MLQRGLKIFRLDVHWVTNMLANGYKVVWHLGAKEERGGGAHFELITHSDFCLECLQANYLPGCYLYYQPVALPLERGHC